MAMTGLIIDEAAAMPRPVLGKLVSGFPRVLLTTTVQGYEGTGRGFMLKFCAGISGLKTFHLNRPVHWACGDPLEHFIDTLLLFDDDDFRRKPEGDCQIVVLESHTWREEPGPLRALYQLLSGAHYRTSPLDLRRMMDALGQHFILANAADECTVGGVWLVEEGGLAESLSMAIWAGFSRPRGNLVAQSLAAHGGSPCAATRFAACASVVLPFILHGSVKVWGEN